MNKIPCFVAKDPDMLPASYWMEGDISRIMDRFLKIDAQLDQLNNKVNDISTSDKTILKEVQSTQATIRSLPVKNISTRKEISAPFRTQNQIPDTISTNTDDSDGGSHAHNVWGTPA